MSESSPNARIPLKGLKSPYPYFGGKSRAAELIWSRLGTDITNYVEPFLGSAAVWLGRPSGLTCDAVVNDLDGNVANFWRSMKMYPEQVANAANNPINEADLHARHLWLITNLPKLTPRLMADPEYCEPRTAGWWAWGIASWIGGGFCNGEGPWGALVDEEGVPYLGKLSDGPGVSKPIPMPSGGNRGVHRKMPQVGASGVNQDLVDLDGARAGVARPMPSLTSNLGVNANIPGGVPYQVPQIPGSVGVNARGLGPTDSSRLAGLMSWFERLQEAFRMVTVVCGDWSRICTVSTMTRSGVCGVILDPPYSQTDAVYAHDSSTVAHDVRKWCVENGANPLIRIAMCGHEGEHHELEDHGWAVTTWNKAGGYQGSDDRERIWFSPHCLTDGIKHGIKRKLF